VNDTSPKKNGNGLRATDDAAPVMIWISDQNMLCTYVSDGWLRFSGRTIDEELGYGWAERVHPDDLNHCLETVIQAFDARRDFNAEYRLRRFDGEYRWVVKSGTPWYSPDGSFGGYIGSCIDIHDSKQRERELQLSNRSMRKALEASKSAVWEWQIKSGQNAWFGDMNALFASMLRTMQCLHSRIHPEDRNWLWDAVLHAMRNHETFNEEFRVLQPNRTVIWMEARGVFAYGPAGQPESMLGFIMDVTDRRRKEDTFLRAEQWYRDIVTSADVVICRSDPQTPGFTFVSKEVEKLFGYPVESWTTQEEFWQQHLHYADRAWVPAFCQRAREEKRSYDLEYRVVASDNRLVWIRDITQVIVRHGEAAEFISVLVDVTERKQAEEEFVEWGTRNVTAGSQEQRVLEQEQEIDLVKRLAFVSTEFRELCHRPTRNRRQFTASLEQLRDQLAEISQDARRASFRLNCFTLARLGLAGALRSLVHRLQQQGLDITFTSRNLPDSIPADTRECLFHVAREALANVVVHSGVKEASVELAGRAGSVFLIITDKGKGFAPDSTNNRHGFGLLSMSERLRLIHGTLTIRSQPSQGTEVIAQVPVPVIASGRNAA
jgi:PAS domain S-box-containing protein